MQTVCVCVYKCSCARSTHLWRPPESATVNVGLYTTLTSFYCVCVESFCYPDGDLGNRHLPPCEDRWTSWYQNHRPHKVFEGWDLGRNHTRPVVLHRTKARMDLLPRWTLGVGLKRARARYRQPSVSSPLIPGFNVGLRRRQGGGVVRHAAVPGRLRGLCPDELCVCVCSLTCQQLTQGRLNSILGDGCGREGGWQWPPKDDSGSDELWTRCFVSRRPSPPRPCPLQWSEQTWPPCVTPQKLPLPPHRFGRRFALSPDWIGG